MARLGDICNFQSGGTPSKSEPAFFGGTIPWITTVALNGSTINDDFAIDWITERAIAESAAKIVPSNSIMVGTRVGIGKVAINAVPMSTSQDIISLVGIDDSRWYKPYLCKLILSKSDYLNSQARGATIRGIKIDTLADLEIPNLPFELQLHIAAVLDKVSDLIALRKQQLAKLDELVKARFVEMFGDIISNNMKWTVAKLADISSSRLGKMLDAKQQTGENTYPYLANFNVQWFHFDLSNLNSMDFNEADQKEFSLIDGDLMVTEGGEVGRCAVWHNDISPCFFQKAIHRVRCDTTKILPDYLSWWFKIHADYNAFEDVVGGVTSIAHLPGVKLKKLDVVIPPLELQNQFAAFVKQVNQSKATVQQGLDKLETLKKALMQEYFG